MKLHLESLRLEQLNLNKWNIKHFAVKVKMKNAPQGLAPWSNVPVKGFELAGEDRKFYPAEARVWGSVVTVWSKQVPKPVAVRYAFHNVCGEVNLRNLYGVPAVPFRTDRWNDVK